METGWELERRARTADEMESCAAQLARFLVPGDVVALRGPLGAGKTAFARGIVRALHGSDPVSSPTFTFWHRYDGDPPVNHLDLYRVDERGEVLELGLEEAFDTHSITLVEWPERAPAFLPERYIDVVIAGSGSEPREVRMRRIMR